jgi:hypothetical protein
MNSTIPWSFGKLINAFPVHYYGPVLVADDGDVAMETLVLTHEGIIVETV